MQTPQLPKDPTLEEKIQRYWFISSVWNGRHQALLTVEEALKQTSATIAELNPHRTVSRRMQELRHEIIYDRPLSAKSQAEEPAPLLSLPAR